MKIIVVLVLVIGSLLALTKRNDRLEDLEQEQEVVLTASVHLASYDDQLGLYLEIVNPYANTIACRGELVTVVERVANERIIIDSNRLVFNKLQVFPDRAFVNSKLVYPIALANDLPTGDSFSLDANYPQIMVTCQGWNFFVQPLDSSFCKQNTAAHDKICLGGVKRYPLLIEDYWLGTCAC